MPHPLPADLERRPVAVIGAGTLGRRIALMFASRGGEVRVHDASREATTAATEFVAAELPALVATIEGGIPGRVTPVTELATAVEGAWLVIEAVPEQLEMKVALFARLDDLAEHDAILATNSSSFPSRELITHVRRPERVLNMHFFMPPQQRAVELMSCGRTDRAVMELLTRELPRIGIRPFEARKESMGFIFNRVWAAMKREVLDVAAQGISTPEEIDELWMMNTGFPEGIFRSMDRIGLDVVLDIEENYASVYPHLPEAPRRLLRQYVDAGQLGVKSGRGFYEYPQ
jgi:3-hydroxybutyryl-CoA dehydrogenase